MKKATDFDQKLLTLFDRYVHGLINRREFLEGASKFAVGGLSAVAILESLNPKYVQAQQIPEDHPQLRTETIEYPSPQGIRNYPGLPGAACKFKRQLARGCGDP